MNKKRSDNFDKFAQKKKGSAVKEEYRQEKKKAKIESRLAGEAARQRKKDKERGIAVEPLGYNKKPGAPKKEYVTGPPKYGEFKRGAGVGSPRLAASKRTPASMDKADAKRTAGIGKVTMSEDTPHEQMPLNKFIAHAGTCGRREAAELVKWRHCFRTRLQSTIQRCSKIKRKGFKTTSDTCLYFIE